MGCLSCGTENPAAARFCMSCGSALAASCPACGHQNPPVARFCMQCGGPLTASTEPGAPGQERPAASPRAYTPKHLAEKILASRDALAGERKQVTVLFADIIGSTELIQALDAEDAQRLLDGAVRVMMDAVHRYEGTVSRLMGDGLMALFGAPLAHEDHAVRACYAALALQDAMRRYAEDVFARHGLRVEARAGLHSGEVVVRLVSDDLHMDYTAMGQTVHLAARMEQLAAGGSSVLTTETLGLVEGYVEVRSLGRAPVKGLANPIEVFELLGAGLARTRLQALAARGLTRFVGRQTELDVLGKALDQAGRGRGQVVAPVGEPGVGKSRLFWEFTRSHRTHGWLILEAPAVSYGKATAYLPLIDLLKAYCRIDPRDDERMIREKVTGKLLALDESLRPTLPAILALLDVEVEDQAWQALDPPERRRRTLDAVKRLLLRESREQPLLLVFEDLHWIDEPTQALLDSLVESLPTARILLLVNYRPEYAHGWGSKSYYTQLRLDPLPPESAEELLGALLGDDAELGPLRQRLIEQTQGNPFFLEESVRTLVETGVLVGDRGAYRPARALSTVEVPATVQAVLAARIDRLPAEEKRLLQSSAVIGKDVPFALLEAIADQPDPDLRAGLAHLQAAEFLYETALFPELEYTFKHALTHEVAYRGLLQERRRALHARIVDAIEVLHADRLEEQIERLAHHALRGELQEKAVDYLRQAGNKAAARSALQDSRAYFEQALGTLEALPESRGTLEQGFDIRLELRSALHQLGDIRGSVERLREAEALAERLDDEPRRGRALALMTVTHSQLGELDEALGSGTRALEIAGRVGDLRLRLLATSYLENVHYYRGDYERAVELATDNLAALPPEWSKEDLGLVVLTSVYDRGKLVLSLAQLGRFGEAAEYEAEAIRLAEPTRHAYNVGEAHFAASKFRLLAGDWATARERVERWITVIRTGHVFLLLPMAVASSAWALAQLGETHEALNRLQEGEQLLERQAAAGRLGRLGFAYYALGRACLLLGRLDEARRLAERALELSRRQPGYAAHALHLLGDIATHTDRFDAERGEAHYRQALALGEPRGMRPLVARGHLGLGKLYRRTDRQDEAHTELSMAITMFREMGMTFWLPEAETELAEAHASTSTRQAG